MTHDDLRDVFATHAMIHMIATGVEGIGVKAYDLADEMMRARAGIRLKVFEPQPVPLVTKGPIGTKRAENVPAFSADAPSNTKQDTDPVKHWTPWSRQDLEKLTRLHRNGITAENIAKAVGRKKHSVVIALRRIKKGLPVGPQSKNRTKTP